MCANLDLSKEKENACAPIMSRQTRVENVHVQQDKFEWVLVASAGKTEFGKREDVSARQVSARYKENANVFQVRYRKQASV